MRCERCGARVHAGTPVNACPRDCRPTLVGPGARYDLVDVALLGLSSFTVTFAMLWAFV